MNVDQVTELLIAEYSSATQRLTQVMLLGERVLTIGVAVLTLAANVAIVQDKDYVLVGLPFAIATLLTYLTYLNTEVMGLGGYRAAIEEVVNDRVGGPVALWESSIASVRHRSRAAYALAVLLCVVWLGTVFVAMAIAVDGGRRGHWAENHSMLAVIGTAASIVVGVIAVIVATMERIREHERVRHFAQTRLAPLRTVDAADAEYGA